MRGQSIDLAIYVGRSVLQNSLLLRVQSVSTLVRGYLERQQQFQWPMFPGVAANLGIGRVPEPIYAFERNGLSIASDQDKSYSDHDSDSDHEGDHGDGHQRYSYRFMMSILKLRQLLKPTADIRKVLALAAEILSVDASKVQDAEAFPLPRELTMRTSLVKLDMGMLLWEQHLWSQDIHRASALYADSSEQTHLNYLCQRSQSITVPASLTPLERNARDIQRC